MANSALRSRNFVLLVLGQVTSLLGNLSLRFALSMYILEATGSATLFSQPQRENENRPQQQENGNRGERDNRPPALMGYLNLPVRWFRV